MAVEPGRESRYIPIIERIFHHHYQSGTEWFVFDRHEILEAANDLGIDVPKNVGDVLYSFRFRRPLPESIIATAGAGQEWIIAPYGRGRYRFELVNELRIAANPGLAVTKILDATPEIIRRYAQSDEQALLAIIRYNRLVDIFTSMTCYSLQSHLRTSVKGIGQVETDELYVGIDRRGAQFIIPVQAKGGSDRLGQTQVRQDILMCAEKYPVLHCRPVAAQFVSGNSVGSESTTVIALFELMESDEGMRIVAERHYRLVAQHELSDSEIADYFGRPL